MTEKQQVEIVPVGDLNGLVYTIRGYYVMISTAYPLNTLPNPPKGG